MKKKPLASRTSIEDEWRTWREQVLVALHVTPAEERFFKAAFFSGAATAAVRAGEGVFARQAMLRECGDFLNELRIQADMVAETVSLLEELERSDLDGEPGRTN